MDLIFTSTRWTRNGASEASRILKAVNASRSTVTARVEYASHACDFSASIASRASGASSASFASFTSDRADDARTAIASCALKGVWI